ncbi:Anthocyanidin 3-O-glucoside 5-O-glucosyltransferase [Morella rubra]|uniref:Glycosyltransferase n=1 Tax=Morella rubra TaxID=262757 RepID=A0A6A1VKL2_9ROSI|nr:Anthocyanidin 3-O-glucoside 5-O-glucosyltransferase [Morella rubra]
MYSTKGYYFVVYGQACLSVWPNRHRKCHAVSSLVHLFKPVHTQACEQCRSIPSTAQPIPRNHCAPPLSINMVHQHILLVTFPNQSHINPSLQFAKRLIQLGVRVTFATSVFTHHRLTQFPTPDGLSFATFSDSYENGFNGGDVDHYMSKLRHHGSQTLSDFIVSSAKEGRTFTCLICAILASWAAEVARVLHLPTMLLWIQPDTVFDIYYYYFNGYGDLIRSSATNDSSQIVELPRLSLLVARDLPTVLDASNKHGFLIPWLQEQFAGLEKESNPKILANTFDALEPEALRAIGRFNLIAIRLVIPSAFLDGKDPLDTSYGGDLLQGSKDSIEWLNSKPESSIIYISFGSISVLSKQQLEEIARGLLSIGHPFLWVIRAKGNREEEKEEDILSCRKELEHKGTIVPWCSQVEVLSHPSVGCFVSHCGWNSTLESLVSGVPMVAFPQWLDQQTNAKLIEDVWRTGVRVTANKDGIVDGHEIKRCLELVIGSAERGDEMRRNAKKWKELAREAAKEGGSSYNNLKAFVDEIRDGCS